MKLKRIMAMVLCVTIVLSSMSFSVFAEGESAKEVTGDYVASIGEQGYETLQDAIDAVHNENTIVLLKKCTEDVTVVQTPDIAFTIDGNDNAISGTITIDGKSAAYATSGLTIENVNFDTKSINKDASINFGGTNDTRYISNVTVKNCTFTGDGNVKVGIKSYTGGDKNLTIIDCKALGLHSLAQLKNVAGVTVSECNIEGKSGISLGASHDAVVSNCVMNLTNYGVRADAIEEGAGVEISDCDISAFIPVVVRNVAENYDLVFSGTNTMTASNTDNIWCAIGASEYEENGKLPTAPESGEVSVILNDADLTTEGIYNGGSADEEGLSVIEIYDLEDLKELDAIVEGGNMLEGVTVKLMNDIDLYEMGADGEPVTFNPIGANSAYFKGIFDGQGHTIKNMYQSGWALGYDWDNYGTIGLFAYLWDATVKNLTIEGSECFVEGGNVAAVAGSAWGNCTFENIDVNNSTLATYNNRAGGIVGYTGGEGTMSFKDITVDEDTVIAGLWGSFDSSLGGLIGSIQDPTKIVVEDSSFKCRLDAYNDCTAAYKYYAYRMCGMLIGKMPVDSENKPVLDNVNIANVKVEFDKWANYTYVRNGKDNENWKRVESGYAYDGVDLSTYSDPDYNSITFESIFGGQQYGCYGQSEHENVEVTYAYVAKNDDINYWTLAEALSKANAGDTIVLLNDVTENVTVKKNIALDGANFSYTGKMTLEKADVTIKNVNFVKGNIYKNKKSGVGGNFTIIDCNFDGQGLNDYAVNLGGTSSISIESCTAKDYGYGFLQVPASNVSVSVKDVQISDVNYGFKIDYSNGVSLENVTVTDARVAGILDSNYGAKTYIIKNCTITGASPIGIWDRNTGNYDTFNFVGNNELGEGEFTISDYAVLNLVDTDATISACVGLNIEAANENYSVAYDNGTYKVGKVAKIGENGYYTLQEAIDEATNGDTIVVVADIYKPQNVTIDNKDIIIDLDGHTVNGAILPSTGNIIVENGSIVNTDANVSAIEINKGKLNLTNVNIESARHAIRIDGAVEATINGGTYKVSGTAGKTQHAINISGDATVTIKNGTFVGPKGTPADSGSAVNVKEGSVVTIENGKFIGGKNSTLSVAGTLSIFGGIFDENPEEYVVNDLNVNYDSFKKLYTVAAGWIISAEADNNEVNAGETVLIKIKASGENFTAADWKLNYESDKFEFVEIMTDIDDTDLHKSEKNYISGIAMNAQSKDEYDNDTILAVYKFTAKKLTEEVTGAFTITDATVGTVAMASSTYPAATPVNDEVKILLNDFTVSVKYKGDDVVNNKVDIPYDGNTHRIDVTTEPDAKVWYSIDEGQTWVEDVPEFTEYGEHKLTYKVDVPDGYDQTAKTPVTITVNIIEPTRLVEVVDYVTGYKLVLVYTNVDGAYFTYDDRNTLMLDVTAAGYNYTDAEGNVSNEEYAHVYGYVVPREMLDAETAQGNEFYEQKVKFAVNTNATPVVVNPYDYNVNCDPLEETIANLADVVYTSGVFNAKDVSMEEAYMKAILKADVYRSKTVNNDDITAVKNNYTENR